MSKLREAAAILVEQGKAIGRLEQARHIITTLTRESATRERAGDSAGAQLLVDLGNRWAEQLGTQERDAAEAQAIATQALSELEHPGAVLARRLLAAWHGARAAWRGTR